MAERALALLPALIILRGLWAKVDAYDAFLAGAKDGARTGVSLLPALTAMLLMLAMARSSGLTEGLTRAVSPAMRLLNLPEEAAGLALLRPLTGSGSTAALQEIFAAYGPDSRVGRVASVIACSSETICYTMTVYLGAAGVKRLPKALPASLLAYAAGLAAAGAIM